jgi:phage-related baseplate assembly protein
VVEDEGRQLLEEYTSERHVVGGMVALSGIHNALHTKGVKQVAIKSPIQDIKASNVEAPYCTSIKLTTKIDYD